MPQIDDDERADACPRDSPNTLPTSRIAERPR